MSTNFETITADAESEESFVPVESLEGEGSMENFAETKAMLEQADAERSMSVAEKIAEVSGGNKFTPQEIEKMAGFLGQENSFIEGLREVEDADRTAEFEANAAISKAQYGENSKTEDYEAIAAEMGLDASAVEEAMGYHIEEDITAPTGMEQIRDAMEDFKGKHPKLFKALKIMGVAGVLLTVSGVAEAAGPIVKGPQVNGPQVNGPQVNGPQVNGPVVHGPGEVSHSYASNAPAPANPGYTVQGGGYHTTGGGNVMGSTTGQMGGR